MRKKIGFQTALFVSLLLVTGCGKSNINERTKVIMPDYECVQYETYKVERGNFVPELTLTIESEKYEKKGYFSVYDDMEVDTIYVSDGDHVEAGQVLISFKSGDIQDQIDAHLEQIGEQQLLLEHYQNLQELDKDTDYADDIDRLKDSIAVNNMYVNELRAKITSYNIVAEGSGTVFNVAPGLDFSTVNHNKNLITIVYGNDAFTAETSEDFNFKEGEIYVGNYGAATYKMKLTSIEEVGKDADGNTKKKLTFVPDADTDVGYRDSMNVTFKRDELKNVIYVPKNCVVRYNNKDYVFLIDDNGFRTVREVVCGDIILSNVVITSGLSDGELVVLP